MLLTAFWFVVVFSCRPTVSPLAATADNGELASVLAGHGDSSSLENPAAAGESGSTGLELPSQISQTNSATPPAHHVVSSRTVLPTAVSIVKDSEQAIEPPRPAMRRNSTRAYGPHSRSVSASPTLLMLGILLRV